MHAYGESLTSERRSVDKELRISVHVDTGGMSAFGKDDPRSGFMLPFGVRQRLRVSETRDIVCESIFFGFAHPAQRAAHFGRCESAVQLRRLIDLTPKIRIMLTCNPRHTVSCLPPSISAMAGGADVRIDLLSQPQVLAGACDRRGIPPQRRQIRG